MQCRTHPERNGVNTCHQCGDWLCEECTVEINGRIFCRKCLAQLAGAPPVPPPTPPYPGAPVGPSPVGVSPAPVYYRAPVPGRRHVSAGIIALLTIFLPIPGVNYMYEGLIKRGLAAMGGFFLIIYALSIFSFWPFSLIFGLAIPIYWLACFFDALNIRRRINAGEAVADDIDDFLGFIKKHLPLILGVIIVLVVLSVAGSVVSVLAYPIRRLLPLVIVVLGLYLLLRKPCKGKKEQDK